MAERGTSTRKKIKIKKLAEKQNDHLHKLIFLKREKSPSLKAYFKVAFDELCCFDCSLYIKADVHFDPCFTVCKLDDWHLRKCQELVHNLAMPKLKSQDSLSTYCSFVKEFDGM